MGTESPSKDSEDAIVIQPFAGSRIFITELCEVSIEGLNKLDLPTELSVFIDDKESYLKRFENFHTALKAKKFDKLILSRIEKKGHSKNILALFEGLNNRYQNTFNYVLFSPNFGCWMGATPERLSTIGSGVIKTEAVAGTKPNGVSRDWTMKERTEHKMVVDFITDRLIAGDCSNLKIEQQEEIKAGKVLHLRTGISAKLPQRERGDEIVQRLHPTSATCGIPQQEAMRFILENEKHNRELYTGYIGILKKDLAQYFVNLRCMKLYNEAAHLYLGGGLTVDSVGELEWEETNAKASTLLSVL